MQKQAAVDIARGKWKSILPAFGIDEKVLDGKHHPCPCTGTGEDRFRFSNKDGKGNFFCACNDGRGDGFALLRCKFGWDYAEAAKQVEKLEGVVSEDKNTEKKRRDPRLDLRMIQSKIRECAGGEWMYRYLESRGISRDRVPDVLRPAVVNYGLSAIGINDRSPAMVAKMVMPDGSPCTYHITYLTPDGKKADHARARVVATPVGEVRKACVRLDEIGEDGILGVAEGIETALSASILFGVPVWATINAGNLSEFTVPKECKCLYVFGDNDRSYTGQAAAYELARRATLVNKVDTMVMIPNEIGSDWNDVLMEKDKSYVR
jgi:putative DNA primase/helicase